MPLRCDCYGGCWGDHSKEWPRVEFDEAIMIWLAKQPSHISSLYYGSYVVADGYIRFETNKLMVDVIELVYAND